MSRPHPHPDRSSCVASVHAAIGQGRHDHRRRRKRHRAPPKPPRSRRSSVDPADLREGTAHEERGTREHHRVHANHSAWGRSSGRPRSRCGRGRGSDTPVGRCAATHPLRTNPRRRLEPAAIRGECLHRPIHHPKPVVSGEVELDRVRSAPAVKAAATSATIVRKVFTACSAPSRDCRAAGTPLARGRCRRS
jgi:hypothetical protein